VPIRLSVRAIRDELLNTAGRQAALGDGASSTRLLGQMFHQVCASLIATDSPTHACNADLQDVEPNLEAWQRAIIDYAYKQVVASQLDSMAGQLRLHATETLRFWQAVKAFCDWIAEIFWGINETHGKLDAAKSLAACEVPMTATLREPGWIDNVELTGITDALLRIPGKAAWCVVELKTGQTSPEADAAQVALYHLIASSIAGQNANDGTVALVSFKPARSETLLRRDQLDGALSSLKQLIGRMAGVLPRPKVEASRRIAGLSPAASNGSPSSAEPAIWRRGMGWGAPTAVHEQLKKELLKILRSLKIPAKASDPPMIGPTFIRFLVEPESGIRVAAFSGKEREIALGMHLVNEPKITRIRGTIAIDIERPDRQNVLFTDLIPFLPPADPLLGNSKLLVGVRLDGTVEFADLAESENCHMVVAGTTGSGKSLWLRAAIGSLTETNSPEQLRLVLIDPKRNAFTAWRNSPHLLRPIVFPDSESVIDVLGELVDEMEQRYRRMENVDDLRQMIRRDNQPEARIVCVCDEYADLVAAHKKQRDEIERLLSRLGSKARAAGIHLILATQSPSRAIITAAINSNLPARVGLKVASPIEAKIIGTPGAEHLLGKGDLLFKAIGEARRLQGAVVSAEELERIARGAEYVPAG